MLDKEKIISALKLWFQPDDVFEIRVLDAITPDYRREHVESGYFDYEHIDFVPDALKKLMSYRGIYVTVNPVNPDLLARAMNRIRPAGRNPTTADADIVARRWLLIDCDAVRPSGISSSDEEHAAAHDKALEIKQGLASIGWPEPIVTDSGNGAQLMYRVDLPVDDGGLVQQSIADIASASSEQVQVDLTVYNPARIWRLPGSMNCKGDSTDGRPHRLAHIVSIPDKLEIVSKDTLLSTISTVGRHVDLIPNKTADFDSEKFSIDDWIRRYCPELGDSVPYNGGRKWVFDVCPFDPAHTNRSAVLTEDADGVIGFRCLHNSCAGHDWKALRELREPGCYDHRTEQDYPGVDLSGILGQKKHTEDQSEEEKPAEDKPESLFPNPGPIPDKLLQVPGFVEEVVQLDMNTAPYPNRILAFTGALSLLAFLAGRKFQDRRDNRTNLYFIALADSGTGKDHPRKINFRIAFDAGLANCIGDTFASGEGLEDALFTHPSMLFQADEFDCIFNTMKYAKDSRAESINEKLLKFYGAANTIYPLRKKALVKKSNGEAEPIAHIVNPNLVLFGTAIPQYFYESLSRRVLENGLAARCIIVEAGRRSKHGEARPITPSDFINRAAKYLADYVPGGNLSNEYPRPYIIPEKTEATKLMQEIQDKCDELYSYFEGKHEAAAMALWARAFEKVCKLAMLHALSTNVYEPVVTEKSVKWAWSFVEHLTKRMLYMADSYVYENQFDEKCQKVVRYLRQANGTISHSKLLHQIHESADTLKKIVETLKEKNTLTVEFDQTRRPAAKFYHLTE